MCNYKMDIKGQIGLSDYSNIYDYIDIIEDKGSVTISMEGLDKENIKLINSMLCEKKFIINSEGYDDLGIYYINACKNT
ncbi:hypothetical protein [Clostridium tarantellae]|uniref:Uncharacterized protein n=1 Tax=Clostridium tarantellae TaxID=39493 RepID=A0A6I1MM04_9CLOT|nr:hypothetical protein [Clostridium tarantellae]MPQ43272.1 hypothetical protein [Clostridium tarantellae]